MAEYVLKDSYTEINGSFSHLSSAYTKLMQTFTASSDYTLYRLAVWIGGTLQYTDQVSGGIYSISGGLPDTLLTSFTLTVTGILTNELKAYTEVDTPLELNSGTQYAIVVDWPGIQFSTYSLLRGWYFDEDHYPGERGMRYYEGAWEDPFPVGYIDICFELYTVSFVLTYPDNGLTNVYLNEDWLMNYLWEDDDDPYPISAYTVHFNGVAQTDRSRYSIIFYKLNLGVTLEYSTTYEWFVRKDLGGEAYIDSDTWSFTTLDFAPPLPSGITLDENGNPTGDATGINNMLTRQRFIAAANNKIWYEDI